VAGIRGVTACMPLTSLIKIFRPHPYNELLIYITTTFVFHRTCERLGDTGHRAPPVPSCTLCGVRTIALRRGAGTVIQVVTSQPVTVVARVWSHVGPREICGGRSGTATLNSPVSIIPPMLHTHSFIYHRRCIMFFSQYSSFPCQYHSTNAPYSFNRLPPTL
jgi:hypothetical protein